MKFLKDFLHPNGSKKFSYCLWPRIFLGFELKKRLQTRVIAFFTNWGFEKSKSHFLQRAKRVRFERNSKEIWNCQVKWDNLSEFQTLCRIIKRGKKSTKKSDCQMSSGGVKQFGFVLVCIMSKNAQILAKVKKNSSNSTAATIHWLINAMATDTVIHQSSKFKITLLLIFQARAYPATDVEL